MVRPIKYNKIVRSINKMKQNIQAYCELKKNISAKNK